MHILTVCALNCKMRKVSDYVTLNRLAIAGCTFPGFGGVSSERKKQGAIKAMSDSQG